MREGSKYVGMPVLRYLQDYRGGEADGCEAAMEDAEEGAAAYCKTGVLVGWLPAEQSEFVSEETGRPAALWRLVYDSDRYAAVQTRVISSGARAHGRVAGCVDCDRRCHGRLGTLVVGDVAHIVYCLPLTSLLVVAYVIFKTYGRCERVILHAERVNELGKSIGKARGVAREGRRLILLNVTEEQARAISNAGSIIHAGSGQHG